MLCTKPSLLAIVAIGFASAAQPSAPAPQPAPLRRLPWGQLNVLHTTDSHGWHAGHLQEAQYSADWGDYISFAHHLKKRADEDGSDLLLVDSGDRVEGNGLYDASRPRGKYTFDIFSKQPMDIIVSGNHELYKAHSVDNEYYKTVPAYKDNYIASNLDIINPETGKREALAPRFRKFTTKNQGIRIVAFGFLFDFRGNANNSIVIPVEETIKQQWFQDAIRDREVDLFVVAGHVPVRDSLEFTAIYKAIRAEQWTVPIQFFGGHTHIRDYTIYDKASVAFESGRYMETIGFQSISGLSTARSTTSTGNPKFERLYIDNNLFSLHTHSGLNETTFPTEEGTNITKTITKARKELNLDEAHGCAPRDFWLNRAPYPSNESLVSWLETDVLPWIGLNVSSSADTTRSSPKRRPSLVLTNTGAMRFDILKGPFTVDSTYLVSPFTSGLRRLRDVPYSKANKIVSILNNAGPVTLNDLLAFDENDDELLPAPEELQAKAAQRMLYRLAPPVAPVRRAFTPPRPVPHNAMFSKQQPLMAHQIPLGHDTPLTPGYTTHDDASDTSPGDDTPHEPIVFYDVPNAVGVEVGVSDDKGEGPSEPPSTVDVVYNEFIEPWIVLVLRYLGESGFKGPGEVVADGKSLTRFLSQWIELHWPCED